MVIESFRFPINWLLEFAIGNFESPVVKIVSLGEL